LRSACRCIGATLALAVAGAAGAGAQGEWPVHGGADGTHWSPLAQVTR
jgi:hypothetical protein